MYLWRQLSNEQREMLVLLRKTQLRPWHSVPHIDSGEDTYLFTGACYEHKQIIGRSPERMAQFEADLLHTIAPGMNDLYAWCILANHYHVLAYCKNLEQTMTGIAEHHGRTSFNWNGDENLRGRKVWHGCAETVMKSEAHTIATINYVHHNPVHHGYCKKWQEWPFSSASEYLKRMGHEEAERLWREYPVKEYGKGWDAPEL